MILKTVIASCLVVASAIAGDLGKIEFENAKGRATKLDDFAGKVILIVNVASKCGFTKQYAGLQKLYEAQKDNDFVILAFPCNNFGSQEPNSIEEIQEFCELNYGVSFPIMAKIDIKGKKQHKLYEALTGPDAAFPKPIKWNFEKILVGKDGQPFARFDSSTKPESEELISTIKLALKK